MLPELEKVNPRGASGHRPRKHHQHLTVNTGIEHLDKQIVMVVTLLHVSDDLDQFRILFDRRFPAQAPRQVLRVTETDSNGFITNFIDDWLYNRMDTRLMFTHFTLDMFSE